MSTNYQILDWDTGFFDIKIASISDSEMTLSEMPGLLSELKDSEVELVYWSSEKEWQEREVRPMNGALVDKKSTFSQDLRDLKDQDFGVIQNIESFGHPHFLGDMEELAIQSGIYSRFSIDPRFATEKFESLYRTWIRNSVSKEIAEEVLIIQEDNKLAGMVTLGEKNGCGDIGLIAVDAECRGRGYGVELVRAAQHWSVRRGYTQAQVVTQGQNAPACALYRKCGYSLKKVEYFYHFWL